MEAVNFLSQPSNWTPRLKPGDRAFLEGVVYPALPEDDASVRRRNGVENARKYRAKKAAERQAKRKCRECGGSMKGEHGTARYCSKCNGQEREVWRRAKERQFAKRVACVGCGAEMEGEHGSAKWCERCRGDG